MFNTIICDGVSGEALGKVADMVAQQDVSVAGIIVEVRSKRVVLRICSFD